jgi:hypothetical protein
VKGGEGNTPASAVERKELPSETAPREAAGPGKTGLGVPTTQKGSAAGTGNQIAARLPRIKRHRGNAPREEPEEDDNPRKPVNGRLRGQRPDLIPVEKWGPYQVLSHFLNRYRRKWHSEPPPTAKQSDLAQVKGRLAFLKAEGCAPDTIRRMVDHLFDAWDAGLGERLRWHGSRPGYGLLTSTYFFDRLLQDTLGVRGRKRPDEYVPPEQRKDEPTAAELGFRDPFEFLGIKKADDEAKGRPEGGGNA